MIVYLDENCFQRSFDDQSQIRIQMETLACQEILFRAEKGEIDLVWSFMHQDETIVCPFPERRTEVFRLSSICRIRIGPESGIQRQAEDFQKQYHLSSKDAVHIACADYSKARYFITCDDKLICKAKDVKSMVIMNPVDFVRKEYL